MIERNTVLILGAGASSPFGFSLGRELADKIADSLFEPTETEVGKRLLECYYPPRQLKDFAAKLRGSHRDSVDAFLEDNRDNPNFLRIGKTAIKVTLMRYEDPNAFQDGNWYRTLSNRMQAPSFPEFEKNKLGVITYNYDRSLEYYLCDKLRSAYGKDKSECCAKISKVPIVHLHGKMDDFLERTANGDPTPTYRRYETRFDCMAAMRSVNDIKIPHENIQNEPQFVEAQKLLKEAEVVCFLGFGYDQRNIERLLNPPGILNGKKVFCSAFKLSLARVDQAKELLGQNAKWGSKDEDCFKFLETYRVLA